MLVAASSSWRSGWLTPWSQARLCLFSSQAVANGGRVSSRAFCTTSKQQHQSTAAEAWLSSTGSCARDPNCGPARAFAPLLLMPACYCICPPCCSKFEVLYNDNHKESVHHLRDTSILIEQPAGKHCMLRTALQSTASPEQPSLSRATAVARTAVSCA